MAKIVDAADIATRDDTIASGREIDLLADHRHRARIFHQFRREESDHVEGAPENVALAAGEEIARLHWIIHHGQMHIESEFFGEHTLIIWLQAGVGDDDRRPTGPNIDRKLDDELAVLHVPRVI